MNQVRILVCLISFILLINTSHSVVEIDIRNSLISFLAKLNGSADPDPSFGWNNATDPCQGSWKGVTCDDKFNSSIKEILLEDSCLSGDFDASFLCNVDVIASSLARIKLTQNNIGGELTDNIVKCKNLTHLLIGHNQMSGSLPDTMPTLKNLKKLDISVNDFSGNLPDLAKISGLIVFLAEYNQLSGGIPQFDFTNLQRFNVSYNNLEGPVPETAGQVSESSFLGNPWLCGPMVRRPCPEDDHNSNSRLDHVLMSLGFTLMGLVLAFTVVFGIYKKKKLQKKKELAKNTKLASVNDTKTKPRGSNAAVECKSGVSIPVISANSIDSGLISTSLIVLTSPVVNGLKFDDLLRAPAELLGRGKHGSLYKVVFENGMYLCVKRIKDWSISNGDFKNRMQRIYEAKHPNVLPPLAFYCSVQEKLLVYEYQQKGSLFNILYGNKRSQTLDWASRLNIATKIAEALTFMHRELHQERIVHGNLKSSNILFNKSMEPCISEYGLMFVNLNTLKGNPISPTSLYQPDIYSFGVILLELLTGKHVQSNGIDLTTWVHSVVKEEWTVEVFDKSLMSEGASEERMVNLLQVAIKCVKFSFDGKLTMKQIWQMINSIKEEEERSMVYNEKAVVMEP